MSYKKKTQEETLKELIEVLNELKENLDTFSFNFAVMTDGFKKYLEYQEEFKKL